MTVMVTETAMVTKTIIKQQSYKDISGHCQGHSEGDSRRWRRWRRVLQWRRRWRQQQQPNNNQLNVATKETVVTAAATVTVTAMKTVKVTAGDVGGGSGVSEITATATAMVVMVAGS